MAKVDRIVKIIEDENEEPYLIDKFNNALVGVFRCGEVTVPVYSYLSMVHLLLEDGVTDEDAVEYIDTHYLDNRSISRQQYIIVDDTGV